MRFLRRFLPRTIASQITCLVVVSLVLAQVLMVTVVVFFAQRSGVMPSPAPTVLRIAAIAQLANAAESPAAAASLLETARRAGIEVEQVSLAQLPFELKPERRARMISRLLNFYREHRSGSGLIDAAAAQRGADSSIIVKMNAENALVFRSSAQPKTFGIVTTRAAFALIIIAVPVIFLSVYAGRWITAPLSSFAAAAHSFGRSPTNDRALDEGGPREIGQVAQALNEMRTRIRALVDNRTRLLAAIGHDLRTPLTRLRLRVERLSDGETRDSMLREIAMIDAMLSETLTYIRDEVRCERSSLVDLPSLLQTIRSEFADVGHQVSYQGPDHFAYPCRPNALTRALTNLVENGVKYGSEVSIDLQIIADNAVQIEVSDNGPGIPFPLREKAFEPFFKSDAARTSSQRTGFGLGLSIARDAIREHEGEIDLVDRIPHGLTVRVVLPVADRGRATTA
jgi:signal transduction histidine kinase